jgi:hypothetical protein
MMMRNKAAAAFVNNFTFKQCFETDFEELKIKYILNIQQICE